MPIARGVVSWAAGPGSVLLIAGGLFGVGVQRSGDDVPVSRRRGVWAAVCTIAGLIETALVLALT